MRELSSPNWFRVRPFLRYGWSLAAVALLVAVGAGPARASCEQTYFSRIGPPAMAQPDGNIQTVTGDCTAGICQDFFDITLQSGDTLYLSFCANGGTAGFPTELAISGPTLSSGVDACDAYECGVGFDQAEVTYVATESGIHRVRIAHAEGATPLDGTYTLAYSAPAGRMITPTTCGNGALDAGEECDDGNQVDGDCCSRGCTYEAVDSECLDEGNDCTRDVCDGAGACTHPNEPLGELCYDGEGFFCTADTCDGAGTCTHVPIPGCTDALPACGAVMPHAPVVFPHPKAASKLELALVQAFVGCNVPGGNAPNATTETGTVPACYPAETFDDDDGSPLGGWHWGSTGKGVVTFFTRCKDAGDVGIKLSLSKVVDENGLPANGNGAFAIAPQLTIMDPLGGPMTVIELPLSLQFTMVNGVGKLITSVNAMLTDQGLPPLPNGFSVTLTGVHALDGGLVEVRDPNGNPFARPGIYLP